MSDQVEGMIRDSDIKFECRQMLFVVAMLPEEIQNMLLPSIQKIVKLENERLDRVKRGTDDTPRV